MDTMKKVLFLAALVLLSAGSYAQKKNVAKAKNLCMMEDTPDFAGARQAIDEALQDPETKDQANTYYVAGLVEFRVDEFARQHGDQDWVKRGKAALDCYNYWLKADQIAMTPIVDSKGKEHVDIRTRKTIAEKMLDLYLGETLIQYGSILNDKRDFEKAYEVFTAHLSIPDLEMMQDQKLQERITKDDMYEKYQFYRARFAFDSKNYDIAIPMFRQMLDKQGGVTQANAGQYLYQSYIELKDSVKANQVLEECINKMPQEIWFMQNMINNLVHSNQSDAAIAYLDRAIASDPQTQYYHVKGTILNSLKRYDEAIASLQVALEREPDNANYNSAAGFVYFDHANQLLDDASNMDMKGYEKAKTQAEALFRQALPYFEKAYQLAPDEYTYKISLRQLYYRLRMTKEYEALSK